MVEKKAPLLLIRAYAQVRARIPDAELVMIGAGPLLPAARQLAQQLQVPVTFMGARSPDAVLEQLHQARVTCLPSVTARNGDAEGFGLTILEAQACGVPVVTSARGGASEGLLQGRTGHAIREGDIAQLQDCLHHWLVNDDAAQAAATAGWQFVHDGFNIAQCTRQLEFAYDGISRVTGRA
jgi:glycosyltransferase involved in cell wall biosynthesis